MVDRIDKLPLDEINAKKEKFKTYVEVKLFSSVILERSTHLACPHWY